MQSFSRLDMKPDGSYAARFEDTDRVSIQLLRFMEKEQIPIGYGFLGTLLTVGRLMKPDEPMSVDEEIEFIQTGVDWLTAYFTTSEVVH